MIRPTEMREKSRVCDSYTYGPKGNEERTGYSYKGGHDCCNKVPCIHHHHYHRAVIVDVVVVVVVAHRFSLYTIGLRRKRDGRAVGS